MAVNVILEAIGKYKKVGQSKWRAPCPAHGGKDNNLMISEHADGKVGCHCFVCGANGLEVVRSLGLSSKELFPPDDGYERPIITQKMRDLEVQDKIVMAMAEAGASMSLADRRRVRLAEARLASINKIREDNNLS